MGAYMATSVSIWPCLWQSFQYLRARRRVDQIAGNLKRQLRPPVRLGRGGYEVLQKSGELEAHFPVFLLLTRLADAARAGIGACLNQPSQSGCRALAERDSAKTPDAMICAGRWG